MVIVPEVDELTEPYWDGAHQNRLLIQSCRSCNTVWHPPTYTCPACMSFDNEWIPASGRAVVYSYTIVHHSVHPATDGLVPYAVVVVRLEEGPLMISSLRDCDNEDIVVGMSVKAAFEQIGDGFVVPVFEPA